MYSWLWRVLPGKKPIKLVQVVLVSAIVLAGLYYFAFPWLDSVLYTEPGTGI
jgi:hypothetical protein